ncbi:MAG: LTA synthase family protein [Lachnospiraceae bacterium]|nr:LTA synthase family protein [Lachnospiraceae bacterium]
MELERETKEEMSEKLVFILEQIAQQKAEAAAEDIIKSAVEKKAKPRSAKNKNFRTIRANKRKKLERKQQRKNRRSTFIIATAVMAVVSFVAVLIGVGVKWMLSLWDSLTIEELIYTAFIAPTEGMNAGMLRSLILTLLAVMIPLGVGLWFGLRFIRRNRKNWYFKATALVSAVCVLFCALTLHSAWVSLDVTQFLIDQEIIGSDSDEDETMKVPEKTAVATVAAPSSLVIDESDTEAFKNADYRTPTDSDSFIDQEYVDPAIVPLRFPETKRNLIFIFLESMEITATDVENGGIEKVSYIPELTQLAKENESFSGDEETLTGGFSAYGSTWTVGAMFTQSAGLPLALPISRNSMDTQSTFIPGVTNLGDILKKAGYTQEIIMGSDAAFAGRDNLYLEHGSYLLHDLIWARETGLVPPKYKVWWGFEDKKLFEFAKDDLTKLAESSQPFNYTMLTVDTHFEGGYKCEDCLNEFNSRYANVYACSSRKVAEFVEWVQQQPFYENTTIIISGDHPTMDGDYFRIPRGYSRRTYFTIINAPLEPEITTKRDYSTLDIFPTTLAALGVKIPGDRLGLGTNLYSSKQTFLEIYGESDLNSKLRKKSDLMKELTADIH